MGLVMGKSHPGWTEVMSLEAAVGAQDKVDAAIGELSAGRPVVLVNKVDEGDAVLAFAAEHATAALVAFTVRHGSGFLCVAMEQADCQRLELGPMPRDQGVHPATAQRTTVDAVGTSTGISARDRAATISSLASETSSAGDFRRPGHVVPLHAEEGGVLSRRGTAEAILDLVRLAGLRPAGAFCALVSAEHPQAIADAAEARRFAAMHELAVVSVDDLFSHRVRAKARVRRCADTSLPTRYGQFRTIGYRSLEDNTEHIALVLGLDDEPAPVPVHVHPECVTGDVLASIGCDCGRALDEAVREMAALGRGVILYVRSVGGATACGLFGPAWADRPSVAATAASILNDLGVSRPRLVGGASHGLRAISSG